MEQPLQLPLRIEASCKSTKVCSNQKKPRYLNVHFCAALWGPEPMSVHISAGFPQLWFSVAVRRRDTRFPYTIYQCAKRYWNSRITMLSETKRERRICHQHTSPTLSAEDKTVPHPDTLALLTLTNFGRCLYISHSLACRKQCCRRGHSRAELKWALVVKSGPRRQRCALINSERSKSFAVAGQAALGIRVAIQI